MIILGSQARARARATTTTSAPTTTVGVYIYIYIYIYIYVYTYIHTLWWITGVGHLRGWSPWENTSFIELLIVLGDVVG